MRSSISTIGALLAGVVTTFLGSVSVEAAHVCRRHVIDHYEYSLRRLDKNLRTQQEQIRCRFETTRRAIHDEIRHVARTLPPHQRADAMRYLHDKLSATDRCYHNEVRELHVDTDRRRRRLLRQREIALRDCETTQCTAACGVDYPLTSPHLPYADRRYWGGRPHPRSEHGPLAERGHDGYVPHARERPRYAHTRHDLDWQRILFGMLGNHLSR